MARLRTEAHARMLGNGMCTRPVELDCRMESLCETCAYFRTGPEFVPVLLRQRDHAARNGTGRTGRSSSTAWSAERARLRLDTDHTYNAGTGASVSAATGAAR